MFSRDADREAIHDCLRSLSNEFFSCRKLESICPFPGNIVQRQDSVVILEMMCQAIQSAARRFVRDKSIRIELELILVADKFLCDTYEEVDYAIRALSEARAETLSGILTNIFGPVERMCCEQKQDAVRYFLRLMQDLDSLLSCMQSVEPDSSKHLLSRLNCFLKSYSVCRRRYMLTVS